MTLEHAKNLVENWNGEDTTFLFEGEIYTENDVNEAFELLEK
jgi:hypothetical protein